MKIPAHKTTIMIHCLDTPKGWRKGQSAIQIMKEVRRWHVVERGWSAEAYAMLCTYSGDTAKGRDLDGDGDVWEETGAGARGWNTNTIHLALQGGKGGSATDKFEDHYTPAQDKWLRETTSEIQRLAGRKMDVIGHNEVAAKACPCFNVGEWMAQVQPVAPVSAPPAPKPQLTGWDAFFALFRSKS
jgi:N-acetylmuramoyl-L-alanine amidase